MGVEDGSMLQADDYLQNYKLEILVKQYEAPKDQPEFLINADDVDLTPKPEAAQNNGKSLQSCAP